jgi:hypothetical protein
LAEHVAKRLHLHVTYQHRAGNTIILKHEVVSVEAWNAGLTEAEDRSEAVSSRRAFGQLESKLRSHGDFERWQSWGGREFAWILDQSETLGSLGSTLKQYASPETEDRAKAACEFKAIIDGIFQRRRLLVVNGRVVPVQAFVAFTRPRAERYRAYSRSVLRAVGQPLDDWRQATVLSILFCPGLAPDVIAPGWWLEKKKPGQTDMERQHGTLVGATKGTEIRARKAKRAWQEQNGYQPETLSGPARGTRYGRTQKRQGFVDHVCQMSKSGMLPRQIASQATACARYREWKGAAAELSISAVQRALRLGQLTN